MSLHAKVVGQTTILSVMGASLALRGPDGSMMTATNGIYEERYIVFKTFGYGLFSTLVSVILCVWLTCSLEASLACNICSLGTMYLMLKHFKRIQKKFFYDEKDTVDFTDLFHAGSGTSIKRGKQRYYSSTSDDDDECASYRDNNHTRKRRQNRLRDYEEGAPIV